MWQLPDGSLEKSQPWGEARRQLLPLANVWLRHFTFVFMSWRASWQRKNGSRQARIWHCHTPHPPKKATEMATLSELFLGTVTQQEWDYWYFLCSSFQTYELWFLQVHTHLHKYTVYFDIKEKVKNKENPKEMKLLMDRNTQHHIGAIFSLNGRYLSHFH